MDCPADEDEAIEAMENLCNVDHARADLGDRDEDEGARNRRIGMSLKPQTSNQPCQVTQVSILLQTKDRWYFPGRKRMDKENKLDLIHIRYREERAESCYYTKPLSAWG